jgi:tetratricopeptide (TPR) repeat protein
VEIQARINGEISELAVSPDGSRIAVSINGAADRAFREVRLLDQNFNLIVSLPGSPDVFDDLRFSPDGLTLRAKTSELDYEQDLGLGSRLEIARKRLAAWTKDDDRVAFDAKASAEKDRERSKVILRDAIAQHPRDLRFILMLANEEFYSARNDRNGAMQLYNQAISIDPFAPMARYMRGKANSITGNANNAIVDFTAAIDLPHVFGGGRFIPGVIYPNEGIAALSYQLNLQGKVELFLRRAVARAAVGEWRSLVDEDVRRLRTKTRPIVLAYELEAFALRNLGDASAAIGSYEQAAALLKDANSYGLEEFENVIKNVAWRDFKLANYKHQIGDIYQSVRRPDEAAVAYAAAKKLIEDAYALPDLTP